MAELKEILTTLVLADGAAGENGKGLSITGGNATEEFWDGGSMRLQGGIAGDGGVGGSVHLVGGVSDPDGIGGDIRLTAGAAGTGGDIRLAAGGGSVAEGNIKLLNLPTADPAVANALWNDSGTLKISAG